METVISHVEDIFIRGHRMTGESLIGMHLNNGNVILKNQISYSNGSPMRVWYSKNGKNHGSYVTYGLRGQIESHRNYYNGVLHGLVYERDIDRTFYYQYGSLVYSRGGGRYPLTLSLIEELDGVQYRTDLLDNEETGYHVHSYRIECGSDISRREISPNICLYQSYIYLDGIMVSSKRIYFTYNHQQKSRLEFLTTSRHESRCSYFDRYGFLVRNK